MSSNKWNPGLYSKEASFVFELASPLVSLLDPQPGEKVLDVGCGSGELSLGFKEVGCVVVGIDSSPQMIASAKEKGLDARVMDGHEMNFEEEFDATRDPKSDINIHEFCIVLLEDIRRSLKSNGRFVAEFGGKGNVTKILDGVGRVFEKKGRGKISNPWFFPSDEEYRKLLQEEGFEVLSCSLIERPTPVPAGPGTWLEIFGGPFFKDATDAERKQLIDEVVQEMEPVLQNEEGVFLADYVRLRVVALKK